MNIVMGFHSSFLSEISYKLYINNEFIGLKIPLIPLSKYVEKYYNIKKWEDYVGYDVAEVRRKCIDKGTNTVKFLAELNKNTFSSMRLSNTVVRTTHVPKECIMRAGRLLIPGSGRFRLPGIGVISTYSDDPVISQVAWTIPLDNNEAKIQALWLNTTLGLLHFLSMRQDSAGGFIQLKKKTLGEILLLDTARVCEDVRTQLLSLFNRYSSINIDNIYTQLGQASIHQGIRYEIDEKFLKLMGANNTQMDFLNRIYSELKEETLFSKKK